MSKLVHGVSQTYWSFLVSFSDTVFSIFAETASSPKRWQISTSIVWSLYSSEVSLCSREAGEKEKRQHARDDGKRKKESLFTFPSFSALSIFRLLLFSLGYPARKPLQWRGLCGGYFGMAVKKRIHYNQYT